MSRLTTLQKAKKLLGCHQDLEPRKLVIQPYSSSSQKNKKELSFSSASKSMSTIKRDFSFCKSKSKSKLENSMRESHSYLKERRHSNTSFLSSYGQQTRYEKIMKLKVKPSYNQTRRQDRNKRSVLNSSVSSCGSRDDKQNKSKTKANRLEKIMQIKVVKPKVNSTLTHYQPRHGNKFSIAQKRQSAVKDWKECQTKIRKAKEQEQKQDRLWKVFERERQLRLKLKQQAQERSFKQQRRKEQRFQSIVSKQVQKIQKQREISKRKSQGFSNYVYPFY